MPIWQAVQTDPESTSTKRPSSSSIVHVGQSLDASSKHHRDRLFAGWEIIGLAGDEFFGGVVLSVETLGRSALNIQPILKYWSIRSSNRFFVALLA